MRKEYHTLSARSQDKKNGLHNQKVMTGAYKTYSESDFQELIMIRDCLSQRKPLQNIDLEAILSVYCGWPVFAMQHSASLFQVIDRALD